MDQEGSELSVCVSIWWQEYWTLVDPRFYSEQIINFKPKPTADPFNHLIRDLEMHTCQYENLTAKHIDMLTEILV